MTEQEQAEHARLIARKAAAFDWYAANGYDIRRKQLDGGWFCEVEGGATFNGDTPLEAVEAAMESEARNANDGQ